MSPCVSKPAHPASSATCDVVHFRVYRNQGFGLATHPPTCWSEFMSEYRYTSNSLLCMHGMQRGDFYPIYFFYGSTNFSFITDTTQAWISRWNYKSSTIKIARICVFRPIFIGKLATIKYSLLLQTEALKAFTPVNMRFLGAKPTGVLLLVHKLENMDKRIVDWTRYKYSRGVAWSKQCEGLPYVFPVEGNHH